MKNLIIVLVFLANVNLTFGSDNTPLKSEELIQHEVFFNTDEYKLSSQEYQKLISFIEEIENVDSDRISIHGFCDDRGAKQYNQMLSSKRAQAIEAIIEQFRTLTNTLVSTKGKGEIKLTTKEKGLIQAFRSLNRKVTIVVAPRTVIAGSFYAEDIKAGDLINLQTLKFKKGFKYLNDDSTDDLEALAQFLVKRTDIYFTINGHVCCTEDGRDSRDKETMKRNLSVVRAKYIRDYLVKRGVDASRVKYKGLKGAYNLGKTDSDDRRVELMIRYIKK